MKSKVGYALVLALIVGGSFGASAQLADMQYFNRNDQNGRNLFETAKDDSVKYGGQKLRVGAGFMQAFQTLKNHNTATPNMVGGVDQNKPIKIEPGFGLAAANMTFDAQLADGVRLNLTLYLASRHHNDTWVKGGYIQMDKLPFLKGELFDNLMKYTTIKVGHMEVNYGDAHFRRNDNGNAILNPFAENLIMDGFATEIAGEVNVHYNGLIGVLGLSNGLLKGDVIEKTNTKTGKTRSKKPSVYGKLGFDGYPVEGWRLRVTQSGYFNGGSTSNTLYSGDRGGSSYWGVLTSSTDLTANMATGRYSPDFSYQVSSLMSNIFTKYRGLELFGTYEWAKGRPYTNDVAQVDKRTVHQIAGDLLYYFGEKENFYVGARYNRLSGELAPTAMDADITRKAFAAGYFFTKNILLKAEYVKQTYDGFPANNIYNGAKFDGFVVEAVVGF
ncbi:hypothetical protein [uncultured Acetobacteroides sp.]|uniref:hypothetical protein n=1 Tax=uncultured Acetobacteroides sp. TaxID=1760811 RepID=UPI0029F4E2F1|nr:hypothetical protein [uncultured Acetobacteroides sp.]